AWVSYETEVAAPPSLVWDYLTLPNLKAQLMGLDYARRIDDLGGRVREEAEFHCAHGELKYDYKIVDWKPFEYFTDKAKDSITGLEYYETN
ncbi:MAG: SRPBCC family protein, partial [candidate division Zixibacteria bacterium]|nr:SRPBCC family protein [Phycisphaerae bacterium]NIR62328.1 SRPBCC family protein [candidate division Zixibacteria bacterium]NIP50812.1 SRPBCC family protein [Phycisphaerae bacterium]NIS44543.1 SRPBCC family protein [candidate division Zixibacteria bacterium]NIU12565.1 SRPBCC family protein [candidate division Zixibacteria bacterium]